MGQCQSDVEKAVALVEFRATKGERLSAPEFGYVASRYRQLDGNQLERLITAGKQGREQMIRLSDIVGAKLYGLLISYAEALQQIKE